MPPQPKMDVARIARFERTVKTYTAPGALDLNFCTHLLAIDGTDGFTLPAPRWEGQRCKVRQISGANTPVGTLTVTGGIIATQNVWSGFDRTTAQLDAAPRGVSYIAIAVNGALVWDVEGFYGVTVA